jgi:hypothetical protein
MDSQKVEETTPPERLETDRIERLAVRRHDRLGGVIQEYARTVTDVLALTGPPSNQPEPSRTLGAWGTHLKFS